MKKSTTKSSLHTGVAQLSGVIMSKDKREAELLRRGFTIERTNLGVIISPPTKQP